MYQNLQKHSQIYELQLPLAQALAQKPSQIHELQITLVHDRKQKPLKNLIFNYIWYRIIMYQNLQKHS